MLRHALYAGGAYFGCVFALGFVLGTMRVLVVVPVLGSEIGAVLLELPFMAFASWALATLLVSRYGLHAIAPRVVMGTTGFALLLVAEAVFARILFDQSVCTWLGTLAEMPGIIGLVG